MPHLDSHVLHGFLRHQKANGIKPISKFGNGVSVYRLVSEVLTKIGKVKPKGYDHKEHCQFHSDQFLEIYPKKGFEQTKASSNLSPDQFIGTPEWNAMQSLSTPSKFLIV